jgi:rhodanese-related sulfurtransferase
MSRNTFYRAVLAAASVGLSLAATASFGAELPPAQSPAVAKECVSCHQAKPNTLFGHFDIIAFKAKTIQMRIDDSVELIKFDEDDVKVTTSAGKTDDGEALHQTRKGQELKIEFSEKDGVKTALRVVEKPPVKIPAEMLVTTAELEKLVSRPAPRGGQFLFDTRPASQFRQGAIPGAVSLPYASFDALAGRLPVDKSAPVIFYCAGPTCSLSSDAAAKAKSLGYSNVQVYRDGIELWSEKNYTVLSGADLKEGWLDPGKPLVLLDARAAKDAAKGFIKGAVSFPEAKAAKLLEALPAKERKPPVVVYDAKDGSHAQNVAKQLIKQGYGDVKVLLGGFDAWKSAKYQVSTGKQPTRASYLPKPRPEEIDLELFKEYVAKLPADVIILDVRNPDEVKAGMVKNAKNIPFDELKARSAQIGRDKLIVTQCTTGVRAEMAYHALKALGFTKVKFLNAKVEFDKSGGYTISKP